MNAVALRVAPPRPSTGTKPEAKPQSPPEAEPEVDTRTPLEKLLGRFK